jgi:prepilin-type N-terminal cleavage/methylation domain-containing protein
MCVCRRPARKARHQGRAGRSVGRRGFTLLEVLIVLTIIGTVTAFALPRVRGAQNEEATRSARREVTASLARAKGTAVQRGCRATLHMRTDVPRVWVTACKTTGSGIDTIGGVSFLSARYGVTMTSSADSLPFAPNSLGLGTAAITMGFTKSGFTSSLQLTPVGRPIW